MFLIDEPDIYLHSDLQRQLVNILRELGPDILIASHSTEIVTESEADEILVVDKRRARASRLKSATQLDGVFRMLGSAVNPVLTQLAKTRRVVFVEGLDFQLLARFARKLGFSKVANRSDFAVVTIEGFNPDRVKTLKRGMETTLGGEIKAAVILDRDYRSSKECENVKLNCDAFCALTIIHESKELENFVLVVDAIDRAAAARLHDRARRGGQQQVYAPIANLALERFAASKFSYVASQYIGSHKRYERSIGSGINETTLGEQALNEINDRWQNKAEKLKMIPGKEAISEINVALQEAYGISLTTNSIVDSMKIVEIPIEIRTLVEKIDHFCSDL